jgi:hypothetical protein
MPAVAVPASADRLFAFLNRRCGLLALALILLGSLRIVATYTVFNHTADEPATLAAGMEWLDKGVYTWEPQHPPLARVAAALGPYLSGIRSQNTPRVESQTTMLSEGAKILYAGHHYDRTLILARLGILPFFWVACLTVYWWGRRYFSPATGVIALFLFSFLPPILAHSGLATLDMAQTAFLGAAFLAGLIWTGQPTILRALAFGANTGLMVLSRLSCLGFFPVVVVLALAVWLLRERPALPALLAAFKQRIPTFGLAVLTGFMVIWAGYRFSLGMVPSLGFSLPFPELFAGVKRMTEHTATGAPGYLLGAYSDKGFWNFYLVGLAVKSPLGFLALFAVGLVLLFKKGSRFCLPWMPLVFSAGVLLVGMFSTINIGIRHVLPVYTGLALIAAIAVVRLWEIGRSRKWVLAFLSAMVLWMAVSSLLSHPDYIPYFNELAGSHPENILVDSDLDWGQDMKRLAAKLHELNAPSVTWMGFVYADLEHEHGFPPIHGMNPYVPSEGWNAVGFTVWKGMRRVYWPDQIPPREVVGKSIALWYFPPAHNVGGR